MKECMFCFQCQETAKNTGCTLGGVCGKKPETANRMDELIRQLKLLALTRKPDRKLGLFAVQSLFMTITNANFDEARIAAQLERAKELTGPTAARAPLGVLSCENEDAASKASPRMRTTPRCSAERTMQSMNSSSGRWRPPRRSSPPEN